MGQTLALVPSTGSGALTPDTPPDWNWSYQEHPAELELFTDVGSLLHLAIGGALVQFGPIPALIGSVAYLGYQFSQVTEPMARTASEVIELAIGIALGVIFRRTN